MNKGIKFLSILLAGTLLVGCGGSTEPKTLEEFLEAGDNCMSAGNYDDALNSYLTALDMNKKNVLAYLDVADAYVAKEDYENAVMILEAGYNTTLNPVIQERLAQYKALRDGTEYVPSAEPMASGSELTEVYNAYADYLQSTSLAYGFEAGSYTAEDENGKYDIIFAPISLDGGGVPELLYFVQKIEGDYTWNYEGEGRILKYENGQVVEAGYFSAGQIIGYLPDQGIIYLKSDYGDGYMTESYYQLSDQGYLAPLAVHQTNPGFDGEESQDIYMIGEMQTEVSREGFTSEIREYSVNSNDSWLYVMGENGEHDVQALVLNDDDIQWLREQIKLPEDR